MCVYLAEKGGLQLCCGVAWVKKLAKGHLQVKKKGTIKSIFPDKPPFKYSHVPPFKLNSNLTEVCLTGGGTVLYLTQKTAAIKPISLQITRAVRGAKEERVMTSKRHPKKCNTLYMQRKVPGISSAYVRLTYKTLIRILSARGSKALPRADFWLGHVLAMYPSSCDRLN